MAREAHLLHTHDAVRLAAYHRPAQDSVTAPGKTSLAIVVAHGLTGSASRPALRRVVSTLAGFGGVVSFDFRGHGRSGGRCTVGDHETLDLVAAVEWARALGYQQVATVGFSLGAAVALRHAAAHRQVDAVVAVSGPSRWFYRDTAPMRRVHWVIEKRLGRLAGRVLRRTRIAATGWNPPPEPPDAAAARIPPTPLLIVHGDADPFFPVDHAQALHNAAGNGSQLWIEPGFGHAEVAISTPLLERIGGWLTSRS